VEYYSNYTRPNGVITPDPSALVSTGVDANINHWSPISCQSRWEPVPGHANWFAVRWSGYIRIDASGDYAFGTISDDGSQVWLDSELIVDNGEGQWWDWEDSLSEGSYTGLYPEGYGRPDSLPGPIQLDYGYHAIEVRMYEYRDWDGIQLWWLKPGAGTSKIPYTGISCAAAGGLQSNPATNWEIVPAGVFVQGPTAVPDPPARDAVTLYPVLPNPFNRLAALRFELPVGGRVRLEVYDVAGRLIRTLLDADLSAGTKSAVWDGTDGTGRAVVSGVYFARLWAGGKLQTVRMSLVR